MEGDGLTSGIGSGGDKASAATVNGAYLCHYKCRYIWWWVGGDVRPRNLEQLLTQCAAVLACRCVRFLCCLLLVWARTMTIIDDDDAAGRICVFMYV
jgi:hypothetical protein